MVTIIRYPNRRVIRLGPRSFAVTLPKDLVDKRKISKGQRISFEEHRGNVILRFGDKNDH